MKVTVQLVLMAMTRQKSVPSARNSIRGSVNRFRSVRRLEKMNAINLWVQKIIHYLNFPTRDHTSGGGNNGKSRNAMTVNNHLFILLRNERYAAKTMRNIWSCRTSAFTLELGLQQYGSLNQFISNLDLFARKQAWVVW